MTWIRVIPFDQDEKLRRAREAQQALYPVDTPSRRTRSMLRPTGSWRPTRSSPTRCTTRLPHLVR